MKKQNERRILWVHGWGFSPEIWKRFVFEWMPPNENTLRQESDPSQEMKLWEHHFFSYAECGSIEEIHESLNQTIQLVRPEAIVGWSMGGLLVLEWLINQEIRRDELSALEWKPVRINKLIFAGSTLCFTGADRRNSWPRRIVERMRESLQKDQNEVLRQFKASVFSHGEQEVWKGTARDREIETTDFTLKGLIAGLEYLMNTDIKEAWLRFVKPRLLLGEVKMLWIHGQNDAICPLGSMPDALPGLERVVIPDAGHVPFLTQPNAFYERVRGFLDDSG